MKYISKEIEHGYENAIALIANLAITEYYSLYHGTFDRQYRLTPPEFERELFWQYITKLQGVIMEACKDIDDFEYLSLIDTYKEYYSEHVFSDGNMADEAHRWLSLFLIQTFAKDDRLKSYYEVKDIIIDHCNDIKKQITGVLDLTKEYSYNFCCLGLDNVVNLLNMDYLRPIVTVYSHLLYYSALKSTIEKRKPVMKNFVDYLRCSVLSRNTIIENISNLKHIIERVRGWAIVLCALHNANLINLHATLYSKAVLYRAFNAEFELNCSEKDYNKYITSYLSEKIPDSAKKITKQDVDDMREKIGV